MKYIKIAILIFLASSVHSQNYSNLIENGKYAKVLKKSLKALKKTPNSIENLYFAAVVSSKSKAGKFYSSQKAYDYYIKAKAEYVKEIDEKKLAKLDKIPINYTSFRILSDSIYVGGFANAIKSNTEEGFIEFLSYFSEATETYKNKAVIERNRLAFEKSKIINNIASFQNFIEKYPNAIEVSQAWKGIHTLTFQEVLTKNTIEGYQEFISKYPSAIQVSEASTQIEKLSFQRAKNSKSSFKMNQFIQKYPNSSVIIEAKKTFNLFQYNENTDENNWLSLKNFIEKYPNNDQVVRAENRLMELVSDSEDLQLLDYVIRNFDDIDSLITKHYRIFTKDGELSTIKKYQANYNQYLTSAFYEDLQHAEEADKLLLHLPFNSLNYSTYLNYLSEVPEKEISYVVVQRILSPYIAKRKFSEAIIALDRLPINHSNEKIQNLKTILSEKNDLSIIPIPLRTLNTLGNEFSPVISADEKTIYFCGQNRSDILGGEDIYQSTILGTNFSTPQINNLSTKGGNEAPVAVSSDGTKMILFQSGKLLFTEKTFSGWSPAEILDDEINRGDWQGDAMLSSDGNIIFFASLRQGEGYNLNDMNDKIYHGDNAYPTDIFMCKKDEYGNWSYPQNLGGIINTPYCERFPFLHPDMKTLYFSSDGHYGLGKLDVYMTTRLNDSCWTCWSKPINLGKEINTCETDAGYKISTNGDVAYYSLNKRKIQESSVIFVLDVSGSMSGEKIATLKEESKTTIQEVINNNAEVAIAAFDGDCSSPITSYLDFTKDYSEVESFIDNLSEGGGTPMYEAYFEASKLLKANNKNPSKNKVIVLMTDGDATSCSDLDNILNQLKKTKSLFKTQTIAFSVNEYSSAHNDLSYIANFSGGELFEANSTQDLGIAFEQANNGIFEIVSGPDNKDIYKITLPTHLRPDVVARIEGELKDSKSQPISATIRWEDLETNKVIGISKSDPQDGSYFIVLQMGKNYGYFIEDSTYFPISQNLDLRDSTRAVKIKKDLKVISFNEMIENGISLQMNNLFFAFGKFELLPSSIPELKRIANIINAYNLKVEIAGHTDDVGEEQDNQLLSDRRAKSVKDFLIKSGCDKILLQTIGYGESRPVDNNNSEEGRSNNRRVEMKFIK